MPEVDIYESIERAARELGLSPDEEQLLEYIATHLQRARVLRALVERWYGDQLRFFPQQAYDNTIKLLARVLKRVLHELRARGIDAQAVDLAIAFEIAPDFDRGAAESSMLAREILETVMAERAAETLGEAEAVASELERFVTETVSSLEQELSELKRVSPEAYRRVVERLAQLVRSSEEVGSRLERVGSTNELLELRSEIERLKKQLEEVRRELRRVRESRKAVRESEPMVRSVEAVCPGGEEPLPLSVVWGALHYGEETAQRESSEFRRWVSRNWGRLPTDVKFDVFGGAVPPTPTPLTQRDKRLWAEAIRRFVDWFRSRYPALAAILEQMPNPIDVLYHYALCLSDGRLYRIRRIGARTRLEWVPETSVLRELRMYAKIAQELAPGAQQLIPLAYPRHYSPFKLYAARFVVTPDRVKAAIGGACPVCGHRRFGEDLICGGDCVSVTCLYCLVSYIMCTDGTKVVSIPANWNKLPHYRSEWRTRLERWAQANGWRITHGFTC